MNHTIIDDATHEQHCIVIDFGECVAGHRLDHVRHGHHHHSILINGEDAGGLAVGAPRHQKGVQIDVDRLGSAFKGNSDIALNSVLRNECEAFLLHRQLYDLSERNT